MPPASSSCIPTRTRTPGCSRTRAGCPAAPTVGSATSSAGPRRCGPRRAAPTSTSCSTSSPSAPRRERAACRGCRRWPAPWRPSGTRTRRPAPERRGRRQGDGGAARRALRARSGAPRALRRAAPTPPPPIRGAAAAVRRGGGVTAGALDPRARRRAIADLTSGELDLLVVGGGITGSGAALDAATRGLHVGLVEARDLAAGTSSASSKVIHGGLRYLEMGDIGLVREALRERELLLTRIAPHLVAPVPFLWPLRRRAWERAYLGAGLALYDTIGGARSVPRHRHMSRKRAPPAAPALPAAAPAGAAPFP